MSETLVDDTEVDTQPWLSEGEFPTQARCNPNCAEEAFLWTYSGLPGMRGAPLPFPIDYLKQVSRRQWDAGARPIGSTIPPVQKIKYQMPRNTDAHWLTAPGVWEGMDAPDRSALDMKAFVASLPQDTKRQLAEALGFNPADALPPDERIVDGFTAPDTAEQEPPARQYGRPSSDGAAVETVPVVFDPIRHTVTEVLAYLRNADPEEQDRVVAIERHLGEARRGVLKRYKEVGL